MAKLLKINDVICKVLSRGEFGKLLDRSHRTILRWIDEGVLLPPSIEDHEGGRDFTRYDKDYKTYYSRKFYLFQEALAVRDLLHKYNSNKKRWNPSVEAVNEIHESMRYWRNLIRTSDPLLMDYPVVLEFKNYQDLVLWVAKAGGSDEVAYQLYKMGDKKLLGVN